MLKMCFKCGAEKALTEFYRHSGMTAGVLGKCKECTKQDVRGNRAKNIDRIQAYDRQRGQDPRRKAAVRQHRKAVATTPEGRARLNGYSRKSAECRQLERAANVIVGNAIRDGKLMRNPCIKCGSKKYLNAHHEDYYKPLDVTWLCRRCHGQRHREINEERRAL